MSNSRGKQFMLSVCCMTLFVVACIVTRQEPRLPPCTFDTIGGTLEKKGSGVRVFFEDMEKGWHGRMRSVDGTADPLSALSGSRGMDDFGEWVTRPSALPSEREQISEVQRLVRASGSDGISIRRAAGNNPDIRSWGWLADGVSDLEKSRTEISTDWRKTFFYDAIEEREHSRERTVRDFDEDDETGTGFSSRRTESDNPIRRGVNWRSFGTPSRKVKEYE